MDYRKCPHVPELTKVTKIHSDAQVQERSSGKVTSTTGHDNCFDGVEHGQFRRTSSLETIPERMIRRSPQVSSLKDFTPPPSLANIRHSDIAMSKDMPKLNHRIKEKLTQMRVQCWSASFVNLLKDHTGTQAFMEFLEKEMSAENLRFWLACQELKDTKRCNIPTLVNEIFREFFPKDANSTINIDASTYKQVEINLTNPSYNIFDKAEEQIFQLMKTDSYPRFLRSEKYKQLLRDSSSSKSRKKSSGRKL